MRQTELKRLTWRARLRANVDRLLARRLSLAALRRVRLLAYAVGGIGDDLVEYGAAVNTYDLRKYLGIYNLQVVSRDKVMFSQQTRTAIQWYLQILPHHEGNDPTMNWDEKILKTHKVHRDLLEQAMFAWGTSDQNG